MATIEERANRMAGWILRRESMLKACNLPKLLKEMLEEQKAIDEDATHAIVEEQVLKAIEKQKAIDIETIPRLYIRWALIVGDKPSWKEYATKAMEG